MMQVNDYQIRLRGMTRRMMATVSELSMLQAHSMKYKADKESLNQLVQTASDALQVDCCLYVVLFPVSACLAVC